MYRVTLDAPDDFDGWRTAARRMAQAQVPPDKVIWIVAGDMPDLLADVDPTAVLPGDDGQAPFTISRAFVDLARIVVLNNDPARFTLLYTLLWRLRKAPHILHDKADTMVQRIDELGQSVRRDIHKMRAFVRFREIGNTQDDERHFVAWFEPDHHIVRANAGFFIRRFPNMRWSILTPEISLHWSDGTMQEGPGAQRGDAPDGDPVEDLWKGYYAAIFNPARLKVRAMQSEMPKKYWRNLPEAALIPDLIAGAQAREAAMIAAEPLAPKTAARR